MHESFGARLRQRREEQGIDLIAIAAQTKIKQSLLESLERDDVSHWPCGIFSRAYIRAYAQTIGLNPDVVVREFLTAHPEQAEAVTTDAISSVVGANGGAPTRLRYIVDSAIDSLSRLRRGQAAEMPATTPTVAAYSAPDSPAHSVSSEARPEEPILSAVAVDAPVIAEEVTAQPQPRAATLEIDLTAVARLCTELGQVEQRHDLQRLLQDATKLLDAAGLILWLWDAEAQGLTPALADGYSDRVLSHLPTVRRDADIVTAAAFRTGQPSAMPGTEHTSGALVVPLLTPTGCTGVLAFETQHGAEQAPSVLAAATIVAAMLAQLTGGSRTEGGVREPEPFDTPDFATAPAFYAASRA